MVGRTKTRKDRPEEWMYEEKKIPKQFMLTTSSSKTIDELATKLGVSRSEILERAIRDGSISRSVEKSAQTEVCLHLKH